MPLALGGKAVFPKSSCEECGKITGRSEGIVLRGGLRGIRERLEFPTRSKSRPSKLPLFNVNGDETCRVDVEIEDYPAIIGLPHLMGPTIADFDDRPVTFRDPWLFLPDPEIENLERKYGIREFATNAINVREFIRMLAKIGHAFAVAELGDLSFSPFLLPVILEGKDTELLRYVGSIEGSAARPYKSEPTHKLRIGIESKGDFRLIVCHIQLFENFGAPAYRVVVGQKPEHIIGPRAFPHSYSPPPQHLAPLRLQVRKKSDPDPSFKTAPIGGKFVRKVLK